MAYPLAAAVVGRFASREGFVLLAVGLVVGLLTIHIGGVAQLAILGGDVRAAVAVGSIPFLLGDLAKLVVAGLVIRRLTSRTNALL